MSWVATLKANVTAWPCSKIVSGPKLCYLKLDFTTTFDKLLICVQYLFGEHYPVPTGSCITLVNGYKNSGCLFPMQTMILRDFTFFLYKFNILVNVDTILYAICIRTFLRKLTERKNKCNDDEYNLFKIKTMQCVLLKLNIYIMMLARIPPQTLAFTVFWPIRVP